MALPAGPTEFAFPNVHPTSPPPTPNSARSRNTSAATFYAVNTQSKRYGIPKFGLSPPEHLEPRGPGHQFSYTPADKDRASDSESDPAGSESDGSIRSKEQTPRPKSDTASNTSDRKPSITRAIDEDTDFSIEELSDDDIGYDDIIVILPDQTEEAKSEAGSKTGERDIIDALKQLQCGGEEEQQRAQQFETAQRHAYQRRKKRWSVGGYKKRSHAQSVGSQSSGHEDIEPLDDIQLPGASARRLRRRTQGPADVERPSRTSLLFDDPPREYEELAVIDEPPPPLLSDSDDDLWSDDDDDSEIEEIELLLPAWLMEIESNPSRPATPGSIASISSEEEEEEEEDEEVE